MTGTSPDTTENLLFAFGRLCFFFQEYFIFPLEDIFYDCVQKYVASDQDLWNNNYPRESTDTPGRALYRETKGSLHGKENAA